MDENKIKEKFELAKKIAESFDEPYKMEGFKVVFEYLLQGSFSKPPQTGAGDADKPKDGEDISDELQSKIKKLAERCGITLDELNKIIRINNDSVDLLTSFSGTEKVQQIRGSQLILLVFELVYNKHSIPSEVLKNTLQTAAIFDKNRNFTTNLRDESKLFIVGKRKGRGKSVSCSLTGNKGISSAIELLRKLTKDEELDEN